MTPRQPGARLELSRDLLRLVQLAADLVNSDEARLQETAAIAYVVSDHPWPVPAPAPEDVASVLALRRRLAGVFADPSAEESVATLDALLAEHPPRFEVDTTDGSPALVVTATAPGLTATLCTQMATAVSVFLRDGGADRIRTCDADDCTGVALLDGPLDGYCRPACRTPRAQPRPADRHDSRRPQGHRP